MHTAILIIGSLLWDNERRTAWRQDRLCVDRQTHVRVPIHYGRRSMSRCDTFTMTFAPGRPLGQAVLLPCAPSVEGSSGLVAEAEELWKAECKGGVCGGNVGSGWGCVGVLFRDRCGSATLRTAWAEYFRVNASPISPVDNNGLLDIRWPVTVNDNTPVDMDVILGIATKAEATAPTSWDIADAWVEQHSGYERYFFENVRHGIRAPDDGLIWTRIEARRPDWLACPAYAQAVAILRAEAAQKV